MIKPVPVLVVDDSQTVRSIVVRYLSELGLSDVDVAENGARALDRLHQKPYGLVISDWEMPEGSGEELLKALRCDPSCAKTPVIMITTTASRGASWLAGANAYLKKPFTKPDLEKALQVALGGG